MNGCLQNWQHTFNGWKIIHPIFMPGKCLAAINSWADFYAMVKAILIGVCAFFTANRLDGQTIVCMKPLFIKDLLENFMGI